MDHLCYFCFVVTIFYQCIDIVLILFSYSSPNDYRLLAENGKPLMPTLAGGEGEGAYRLLHISINSLEQIYLIEYAVSIFLGPLYFFRNILTAMLLVSLCLIINYRPRPEKPLFWGCYQLCSNQYVQRISIVLILC